MRIAIATLVVALGFAFVLAVFASSLTEENVGGRDYIQYWASGRLLLRHINPYDPGAVLRLEQASGSSLTAAEISFSPPQVLSLSLVLALFNAKNGLIVLFALMLASVALSLRIIWRLHGSPDTLLPLLGLLFAPVLACLRAGQVSIFFLLGICLFLYYQEYRQQYRQDRFQVLAGAALLPLILKPHLFLAFGVALLLWIVKTRRYGVITGFLTAVAISSAAPFYLDRNLWAQYTQMIHDAAITDHFVPSLGYVLRLGLAPAATWIEFVPELAACAWAAWFFWTRRHRWQWMDQGMLVLLVSVVCRPYGWFFDEAVLLPAMMTALFRARESGRSLIPFAVVGGAALLQMTQVPKMASPLYLWTAPAWLACYLYATVRTSRTAQLHRATEAL
ncbi:MAG: glycosyltransferase 87 family protein [Terracidiphilus sp.]